jgi:hypothetical protein
MWNVKPGRWQWFAGQAVKNFGPEPAAQHIRKYNRKQYTIRCKQCAQTVTPFYVGQVAIVN